MKRAIVAGCGLSGAVVSRYLAENLGYQVTVYERRNHIGGNMYDYVNEEGILVHKYGPHTFHTKKKELFDFMCRFSRWKEFRLTCGAVINGRYTPTPFGFQTMDDFFPKEKADRIKQAVREEFAGRKEAAVLELLHSKHPLVREYAQFLFDYDYSLYTAKQWGVSPGEIDPSVLRRVPVRFGYETEYFDDEYQFMPAVSYTSFFERLLDDPKITVLLGEDILRHVRMDAGQGQIWLDGEKWTGPFVFTGAVDELLGHKYGKLPYRSLRFEWKDECVKSFQPAPVVAYPQAEGFTRITEYTKLPMQDVGEKTVYAVEYPLPYVPGREMEPYYPIPGADQSALYERYRNDAARFGNLFLCGRLAEYQYYNMDQALENALKLCGELKPASERGQEFR